MSRSEEGGEGRIPRALRPGFGWGLRMAWRDSRGQRRLLGLFIFCIVFGIAALVAIRSLRSNLEETIERESRGLVGADLVLQTRQPPEVELRRWMARLGGEQASERRFRSMAYFPAVEQSRFVQVRALAGGFPFYGKLETVPAEASFRGLEGAPGALVEQALLDRFGLGVGDTVVLGDQSFRVVGALVRVAGESEMAGFFAPRILIDGAAAEATGLLQTGSVVDYRQYFRFADGLGEAETAALAAARPELFVDAGVRTTTVEDRKRSIARILDNLFNYLNLVGFIALLLGGLGVGGAVQVYLQPKLDSVAVLRCLGASVRAASTVYLWQVMVVGLVGAILGAAAGVGAQSILPLLLGGFLPFAVEVSVDVPSILFGLGFGWLVATLFALRPLLRLRHVSPLRALRASVEPAPPRFDGARFTVTLVLAGVCLGFALLQTREPWHGLAFAGALGACFAILAGSASLLRAGLRRILSPRWPFGWRLAVSNLYRPQNRTVFLVTTLGLGTFLIATLYLSRDALLAQLASRQDPGQANVILIDVQPDQVEAVTTDLEAQGFAVADVLPVVTMRVESLKGRSLREWRQDPESPVSNWVYSWEFRVSYRDHILDNATITAGEFTGRHDGREPIPISLSEGLLDDLGVTVGDEIVWDVQGFPMRTVVGSIRSINWQLGRENFGVLWPLGVLEDAPAMYAISTRVRDRGETVALQQLLQSRHANVSLIDLSLVYETINDVLSRVAFVIQFMAGFTVLTGLIVLFGAVATSRYQRIKEGVLLRTLGASGRLVRQVLTAEYVILGAMAAAIGLGLAVLAAWGLVVWVFKVPFAFSAGWTLAGFALVVGLTVGAGWLGAWGLTGRSPLEVLRREG
jgi:putative ABC transport system permease protein